MHSVGSKKPNLCLLALFSGEAQDILLRQSRLAQFYQDFAAKATVLVITTELEYIFQDFAAYAPLLVPPTELEIFYQDFAAKG